MICLNWNAYIYNSGRIFAISLRDFKKEIRKWEYENLKIGIRK